MKKVRYLKFIIYYNTLLEICCSFCYYLNIHSGHKVVQINDEETLNKENISLESSYKDYKQYEEKIINLKGKIEEEIKKIDKIYDEIDKDITSSYKEKHLNLIKSENELKESLQNEVTKVKEKLENFLSESNRLIKMNEKLNKGIEKIQKEEKNFLKVLNYVSNINKNKKEMNLLFQESIKIIKISFEPDNNNIKFEEYYFNGLPIPKDIEVKNIESNKFDLNWKIDEEKFPETKNNQINYIVEIRKENKNEDNQFIKSYEGSQTNCTIKNLIFDTQYELRICCVHNNSKSLWSNTQKVKTKQLLDSIILKQSPKRDEYLKKIFEWLNYKYDNMELIYRGSRDGSKSDNFHSKCDNKGPTICLYKNEKGNIFGGYASISWTSDNKQHSAPESFIFTLENIHKTNPTKFPSKNTNNDVSHYSNCGPEFFGDIYIKSDFNNTNTTSDFPNSYDDILGKGKSIFTGEIDNNKTSFKVKEIEVFKLSKS